ATRDAMHHKIAGDEAALSDSMRMFKWGVDGGHPAGEEPGVQPEWFYKGDGSIVAAPGAPLHSPAFALDGGEEPELVGLYLIGPDGQPHRLGFAVGNEFSDHVTERQNYLYLAHSKLRPCAVGPELRLGELPADLRGSSRIRRGDAVVWEKPFVTGEANMCHSLANLEYHHFKYAGHRRPGDVHLHFFGTATLSFADGIQVQAGDRFEIELTGFGEPLVNPLASQPAGFAFGGVKAL
ncbi:MAG TPA: AraD1 family protein, partial [Ideonella sp.]|nr:AraD1 family protein [Ideonella sp.]